YVLLHHVFGEVNGKKGAWGHAIGGMGAITQALAAACVEQGVDIRLDAPVVEVMIEKGRAVGAVTEAGDVIRARAVVSNLHPRLLFDRLVDPVAEGFDLDVRIGDEIAPQLIARRLMVNHRILCAAPAYLAQHGTPRTLQDLAGHQCLVIKERDHPFGVWRLRAKGGEVTVKVSGALSTNHGEVALRWALDGAGIVLRSRWHAQPLLASGQLVQILPEYAQEANVWAVYPQRLGNSAKVRVCVEFLERELAANMAADRAPDAGA
ncbi:MAG: LysR substrate-binding domain-containing protein, partial [Massilia sp.]